MLFTEKIKYNKDFTFLFKRGRTVVGNTCVVYFRKNNSPYNRIGISSSKKIGNAVKRNRARRVIRAAYYECESLFPIGYSMIIVARQASTVVKSGVIKKFLINRVIPEMNKPENK